jgi:uncharacterized protein (TIGR02444 family)
MTALWDWALQAYARPGAAETLLEMQNAHRQSVPYLLWAAWAAREERPLSRSVLAAGAALAERWEQSATGPLRFVRRALKAPAPGVPEPAQEALRAQVQALELEAERVLLAALESLAPAPTGAAISLEASLPAAAHAWAFPVPPAALVRLARVLA